MKRRWFGLGLMVLLGLSGCASGGGPAPSDTLSVGQRVEELVARKGQPQEIQPGPGGSKTYVYTTTNMDQTATMGGGAWAKPDQVYYRLNEQGVITEVNRYPYGKRSFIFPAMKAAQTAKAPVATEQAAAAPVTPAPAPVPAPTMPPREAPKAAPQPPGALAKSSLEGATRLEMNMSREDVQRVLGTPTRTEGYRSGGRAVIVWYYLLEDPQGRRALTPLVFEEGRLSGWGENYYRRRLREVPGQVP